MVPPLTQGPRATLEFPSRLIKPIYSLPSQQQQSAGGQKGKLDVIAHLDFPSATVRFSWAVSRREQFIQHFQEPLSAHKTALRSEH